MSLRLNHQLSSCNSSDNLLILVHGLFGSLDNLSIVRRYFEKKVNVLSVDLPDHGQSPHTDNFSLEQCEQGLVNLIEKYPHEKICLLGHSLGGKAAMLTALKHQEKIQQLIVADIAPVEYSAKHDNIISALRSVDLQKIKDRSDADNQLSETITESGIRQFLLKSLNKNEHGNWTWKFNLTGLAENYAQIKGWPEIDAQYQGDTLFIKGGNSDYLLPSMQKQIARYFPHAKAHVIEGAGHWLHAEKPQSFNRIVEKYLFRL